MLLIYSIFTFIQDDWGKHNIAQQDQTDSSPNRRGGGKNTPSCCGGICRKCKAGCLPILRCCCCQDNNLDNYDIEDGRFLIDTDGSPSSSHGNNSPRMHVYWISYLEGMQRVLAFSTDSNIIRMLMRVWKDLFLFVSFLCYYYAVITIDTWPNFNET